MKLLNKITAFLLIFFGALFAKDADHGEELYNFSNCTSCHDPSHFTNEKRKAKNYKQLIQSVDACRYSTNVDWFDEDRDDVVHYLNKEYYKFNP